MFAIEGSSETGLFESLSNHVVRCPYFRKCISYGGHIFIRNVKNFTYISKTQKKKKIFGNTDFVS